MTNEEKRNIYNSIQNLYNMDFTTWQEVLAMLYNLVADVEQKFEKLEAKFTLMLGKEVTEAIRKMHESGELAEIINQEIFSDLNNKIDEIKTSILNVLSRIDSADKEIGKVNEQLDNIAKREYIPLDSFGESQEAYQQCFDYCNENGIGILIPSKTFYINEPIILKENGTYYIKGSNTSMNDGSKIKSKSVLIPKTILFKGENTEDNTTVYMSLENVRLMPEKANGYTKDGTYIFYNLNLFGLYLRNVTCRHIDVFCQGYVSKASVIDSCRFSFIKSALFKGNVFNGSFMADSQITNCYISGAYPVTLFHGRCVNTTVSHCFFDFFKHMQSLGDNSKNDGLNFKNNTIGMFYRWFKEDVCRGHVEIIGNKIESVSREEIEKWKGTNFVNIDTDMESGTYGVFYGTSWQQNINGNGNDKCKVHSNRFVGCDNMFTKSNNFAQVDIRNNTHTNITGITYELSYRKDSLGESASFYCDKLDNLVCENLPVISSGGNYFVFNGQRCFVNNREYVLIDYKWVEVANNNVYSTSPTPTYTGTYNGKPLYKRLMEGTLTVGSTGFKTPVNIPDAELLFVDLTHSYWNVTGQTTKFSFNANIKTGVTTQSINLLAYESKKVLMYQQEGASSDVSIDYCIAIEYTLS